MRRIENAEQYEDITGTALLLRDVLEDLCTQPIPSVENARDLGYRLKLLASCLDDTGNCLIDGVFILTN